MTQGGGRPSAMRKLLLRLDDGSLLAGGNGPPQRLSVEDAHKAGKLGAEHVLRAQKLVHCMEAVLFGDSWVEATHGEKRKLDTPPVNGGFKRLRSLAGASSYGGAGRRAGSPSASQLSFGENDYDTCLEIVQQVLADLGGSAHIFANPVDENYVPGYYKVIKNPMDLGTISGKLHRREYHSINEFQEDMALVWSNCAKYNKKGSPVAKLGLRADATFQRLWAASGLCPAARSRRQNAGVAAAKYEPPALAAAPAKRTTTGSKAPRGAASKGKANKMERMQSTDNFQPRPMPHEVMQQLAMDIQGLPEDMLQGVFAILREADRYADVDEGEIELDFDTIPPADAWKLHAYVERVKAGGGGTPANGGADQAMAASESESDSDSDSE